MVSIQRKVEMPHETAQVKPVLISQHKGIRRRFGKSWVVARVNKARFGDEGHLCRPTPAQSLRQDSQALRPLGRERARRPRATARDTEPGSVICVLRVCSRRMKPAGPSPRKGCEGAVRAERKRGCGRSPDPGARRLLPRFY